MNWEEFKSIDMYRPVSVMNPGFRREWIRRLKNYEKDLQYELRGPGEYQYSPIGILAHIVITMCTTSTKWKRNALGIEDQYYCLIDDCDNDPELLPREYYLTNELRKLSGLCIEDEIFIRDYLYPTDFGCDGIGCWIEENIDASFKREGP